jgi:hypothetical protein
MLIMFATNNRSLTRLWTDEGVSVRVLSMFRVVADLCKAS